MTSEHTVRLKELSTSIDRDEPQLWLPVNFDLPEEHFVRANPKAGLVVQRAVHHHGALLETSLFARSLSRQDAQP